MRKVFLTALLAFSLSSYAQTTTKEVDLSMTYYDVLTLIKKNEALKNAIGRYDKMTEVYDGDILTKVLISDSLFNIEITPLKLGYDVILTSNDGKERYYLTVIEDALMGHGIVLDLKLSRLLTYYLQNEKIIKQSSIK